MKLLSKTPGIDREEGGIAILTVLMLLVLATVVAFSMARVSIRELSVTGSTWQGAKASEASEAGLDWFILWANPDNQALAVDRQRNTLISAMESLNSPTTWSDPAINTYIADSGKTWDRAVKVTSTESDTASDMVFANSGTGFTQSSATTGNAVVQSFDIRLRYLGVPLLNAVSSGAGSPAGAGSGKTGRQLNLYQVQSTGKASVSLGGVAYMRYLANREMFVTMVP